MSSVATRFSTNASRLAGSDTSGEVSLPSAARWREQQVRQEWGGLVIALDERHGPERASPVPAFGSGHWACSPSIATTSPWCDRKAQGSAALGLLLRVRSRGELVSQQGRRSNSEAERVASVVANWATAPTSARDDTLLAVEALLAA